MEIFKEYSFEAAHHLPKVPPDHQCRRVHGHSYRVAIHVTGFVGEESGWVVDFADISRVWKPLEKELDHSYLNEIAGLENPTSEHLAHWIWQRLELALPGLAKIVVRETCSSGCVYRGELNP